ncbi:MAG: MarC family protein [Vulcanimicrobiaceae bacterium]|jgi:multiple antibiotic resistance protein
MTSRLFYDFITLLAVINPIEAAATFATLTGRRSAAEQVQIARRASVTALAILVVFGFVGGGLLTALGIGFPAFRIAGGLLLFCVGFKMVFARETGTQELSADEQAHAVSTDDPSVFPLAIPIITGPGALTTIVALMSKRHEAPLEYVGVVVISVVVLFITYWTMREARWLTKAFGPSGINAVGRIMGIIVAAIAIQLILDGLVEVFPILNRA